MKVSIGEAAGLNDQQVVEFNKLQAAIKSSLGGVSYRAATVALVDLLFLVGLQQPRQARIGMAAILRNLATELEM